MAVWILVAVALPALAAAAGDAPQVTCGSVIKLAHFGTKYLLHSHEIAYGSGSGQQSVTGYPTGDDANSLWIVRGPKEASCLQGAAISSETQIRLQHAGTRKYLHSHHFQSPLSGNQEVSAFGGDDQSDYGDVWQVEWTQAGSAWQRDQKVRLRHPQTGMYLASSNQRYQRPIAGQQEIYGRSKEDWWTATEGLYFPMRS